MICNDLFRATLAVYPWTLFFMCWIFFAQVHTKQVKTKVMV